MIVPTASSSRNGVQSADVNTAVGLVRCQTRFTRYRLSTFFLQDSTSFPNEPPPEYSSEKSQTTDPNTQGAQPQAVEDTLPLVPTSVTATSPKAANYISLNQPLSSINCTYIIDPLIQIPQSFLPALAPGQSEADRKNLSIRTKMGSITADITVWHDDSVSRTPKDGNRPRVSLEMKTMLGEMDVKVVRSEILRLILSVVSLVLTFFYFFQNSETQPLYPALSVLRFDFDASREQER
jgi:hypothetical protein